MTNVGKEKEPVQKKRENRGQQRRKNSKDKGEQDREKKKINGNTMTMVQAPTILVA